MLLCSKICGCVPKFVVTFKNFWLHSKISGCVQKFVVMLKNVWLRSKICVYVKKNCGYVQKKFQADEVLIQE
jgi:hypothetical protein